MTFSREYLEFANKAVAGLDVRQIENVVKVLVRCRDAGGRLFLVGSGGGAGHASHAVCDFRKLCGFEIHKFLHEKSTSKSA